MEINTGQSIFDWVLAGFSALFGYFLSMVRDQINDLQSADKVMISKMNEIEVLVAGKYVTRVDFDSKIDKLFEKLSTIDEKLDAKVSIEECRRWHSKGRVDE